MAKRKRASEEARRPDAFQQGAGTAMKVIEKNFTLILGVCGGLLALGVALVAIDMVGKQNEQTAAATLFPTEKAYLEKKDQFDRWDAWQRQVKGLSKEELEKREKNKPKDMVERTGDLQKDYSAVVSGFENVIATKSGTVAAKTAALYLSEIYRNYDKNAEAIAALQKVEKDLDGKNLIDALVILELGSRQADAGNCDVADSTWLKIPEMDRLKFVRNEVTLRRAFCLRSKDPAQAASLLKDLSLDEAESAAGRSAKRYMRTLDANASR